MKIAFFIGSLRRGGAERVISILANHYARRGWQVDILLLLENQCGYELESGEMCIRDRLWICAGTGRYDA